MKACRCGSIDKIAEQYAFDAFSEQPFEDVGGVAAPAAAGVVGHVCQAHYRTCSATTRLCGAGDSVFQRGELDAKAFNQYLADDGIPDILVARRKDGSLAKLARERYSKHIKAIFQVGAERSSAWSVVLGHPAELVPLENPYVLRPGGTIRLRCLVDGQPVANQLVLVGGRIGAMGDARLPIQSLRTNADGTVAVSLPRAGRWYVKFIHMKRVDDGRVNYESKWATITFEVR